MVHQNFHSVCLIFTFFLFAVLEIAQSQQPTPTTSTSSSSAHSSSSGSNYHTEINGGEIGMRMSYNSAVNPKLAVSIYYATAVDSAKNFFQTQLTDEVLNGFIGCGVVDFKIMPCGTSRITNGQLTCLNDQQCTFDKLHACIATLYPNDQQKIGLFVICFFTQNNDVKTCASNVQGWVYADIDNCAKNEGANDCDSFFRTIHPKDPPALTPPSGTASTEGTTNFKGVVCEQLADAQLQCPAMCPASPPPSTK